MLFYDKYYSIITDKIDHPDGKKSKKTDYDAGRNKIEFHGE